jgi:hypothetical protein
MSELIQEFRGRKLEEWEKWYLSDHPVSIKPQTYESKQMLPESIGVQIIYYDKVKDGINIFFEEF